MMAGNEKRMMGNKQGSAAIFSLIIMMLLGSLSAILFLGSNTELQISTNQRDGITAQYLAEAGIQWAIVKLKTDRTFLEETSTEKNVATRTFPELMPSTGMFTVETAPDATVPDKKNRRITATGIMNQAKRQVVAHITLPPTENERSPFRIIWTY